MALYDRRLDAIVVSAELGSFSKAAVQLHISTPALVKQVNTFEGEHGLVLFERTRHGVVLTAAGAALVEDARALMRFSDDALRRARGQGQTGEGSVRLGVSVMCPGQKVLDLWPKVHAFDPSLKLELVPIGSIYDERLDVVGGLGRDVDLILTSYSPERWDGRCCVLPMGEATLAVDVPRGSALAGRDVLALADFDAFNVYILRHANRATDELREDLRRFSRARIIDVDDYDLDLFNECAETGGALITSGAWSGMHPMFVTVPLREERRAACTVLYPLEPVPAVERFVDALRRVAGDAC